MGLRKSYFNGRTNDKERGWQLINGLWMRCRKWMFVVVMTLLWEETNTSWKDVCLPPATAPFFSSNPFPSFLESAWRTRGMPTFSDGGRSRLLPLTTDPPADPPTMNTTNMRLQLQTLLDDKEKQLQLTGTLGQRFLQQQMELEERINQLSEYENAHLKGARVDEANSEMRVKLQELAETMQHWEVENEQIWSGFGSKVRLEHLFFITLFLHLGLQT